jgi:hypothetical protein
MANINIKIGNAKNDTKEKEHMYYTKAGKGKTFANSEKSEDWHSDYQGEVRIPMDAKPGELRYLDIWVNGLKVGTTQKVEQREKPALEAAAADEVSEDIPW